MFRSILHSGACEGCGMNISHIVSVLQVPLSLVLVIVIVLFFESYFLCGLYIKANHVLSVQS